MDELIMECEKAYNQKDYSRLDWLCNEILKQQKNNETALSYKLYIYCKWRQYHLVLPIAEKIRRLYPKNYHAYNGEAIACLAKREFENALEMCDKGLEIKDYSWLKINKIEALVGLNSIDEAYEFYTSSQIPDYSFTKALINCSKYSQLSGYDDISDEELVECLLKRCSYLDGLGNREEVLTVCDEILKMDKDNEAALIYKAYALAYLERNDELLRLSDCAIRLYPKVAIFYLLKADVVYYDLKDFDRAIELYEKGLSLLANPQKHWAHADKLVSALNDKAEQLIALENYRDAVLTYDKILFYKPEESQALDKINSLTDKHNIDYNPTRHYNESLRLKEESQRIIKQRDDFLKTIVIGEYDEGYVSGCSEFKDYNSFEEYVRDVIICLMESHPRRSEEDSRFLAKCKMEYIKSSFEYKEPAAYCIIEVEYCCG